MLRSAAVAGQFYPEDFDQLSKMVSDYCPSGEKVSRPIGIIAPHAGYIYSGRIAGEIYSRVEIPDRVILLGPNHRGIGHPGAVYHRGGWAIPGGRINIDTELADRVLKACPPFAADKEAHRYEHSLEVHLPFIHHLNPNARLVPICIGHLSLEQLLAAGHGLGEVIAASEEPVLIIASSDMTHFESAESAKRKDQLALSHVENIDPEGLYRTVTTQGISMCGVLPSVVLLAAARRLSASHGDLIAYGTSGDVNGDYSDVVAYASVMIN